MITSQKNKILSSKLFQSILITLITVLTVFAIVKAAPPNSPYKPGETLTPSCSPGGINCTVSTPTISTSTANYIPKFTNNTDIANSVIYENNGNIGIGTTTPAYKFEVEGPIKISGIRNILLRNDLVSKTGVIIPFYRYPWSVNSWDNVFENLLNTLQKYHEVPAFVIINPGNGPGQSLDNVWTRAIKKLHGVGAAVVGYVSTNYTNRDINLVKSDIDTWRNLYPEVDGIFIDEMTYDDNQSHRDYYAEITRYAHKKGFYPVIGNPGASTYGSYFTQETADIIIIWDNLNYPDEATLKGGDWEDSYREIPVWRRAAIVFNQPTLSLDNLRLMQKYTGLVYITNGSGSNPWDGVPFYFEDILIRLAQNNPDIITFTSSGNVGIGTSTPAYSLHILKTASSTIAIGDITHTGCIVMGDSDGNGVTYIYANDGVLYATSTKPAFCE